MPAPYDDASLHAFKRICSSPELTFGPAHVRALAVSGRSPSLWGWHWWRTHTRGGGSRADDAGAGKKRGNEVSAMDMNMNRIFERFFEWTLHDAAAGRTFRTLGELRLLEVGFENQVREDGWSQLESEWATMSPRTRETLHRSFPSLTKLVLKRTRFADEALFVGLMESFSRSLEVLDMDCVAIDGLEHRDGITEPRDGRRKEALLPALRALRLTGISINLAIFLIPSPKLRKVMFDIPDDDMRREVPLPMLVDLLASAQNLRSLSLHNRCSGSFRDADIPTDGSFHRTPDNRHSQQPPPIPHHTLITNAKSDVDLTLHTRPAESSSRSSCTRRYDSEHVPFITGTQIQLSCHRLFYGRSTQEALYPDATTPCFCEFEFEFGRAQTQTQVAVPSPYVPLFMVNMVDDEDEVVEEDDPEEEGAGGRPGYHVHDDNDDDDDDEDDSFPSLMAALSEDSPYANLRMRLREVTRQTEDADEIEDKVEEMLKRMKREEEEEVAVRMREERSRQVFRKFARKLPWCEERGCLRPVFQFDG
ncbi:hypothetical protein AAF712_006318 [Marasmius tenuissimus]|uniref:Uncharacterized protein n=1 Tax=Marasmius tenuissimus TaxID=585030 RepID=A0ABR2ZZA2_9AGAR